MYSAMTVIQKLSNDDSLSSFSRQYLKDRARLFSISVMVSGGSFRALTFMSSNLCGLSVFSSGLSTLQMEQFRRHHVFTTVFTENVPQLVIQFYFLFILGVYTNTAALTFTSSLFNILLSIMTAVVSFFMNRNGKELGFTIQVNWRRSASSLGSKVS